MYIFDSLIEAGARVAAMSDMGDGDCGWPGIAGGTRTDFLRRLHIPAADLVTLRQVHGNHVAVIEQGGAGAGAQAADDAPCDGDGLITATPGIALGVTVADCVPILLFDPATGCVAALHAGREGTAGEIAAWGLAQMMRRFGAHPGDIRAVIGPSAGPCCYEVSEAMRAGWVAQGYVARGRNLDLWASNWAQLRKGGVESAHIVISGHCTLCGGGFYSFRSQGTSLRNLAVIMA